MEGATRGRTSKKGKLILMPLAFSVPIFNEQSNITQAGDRPILFVRNVAIQCNQSNIHAK